MVSAFGVAVKRAANDLDKVEARWAMIGGLTVAARSIPRFTKDVDFVVAVADEAAAESAIHQLGARGHTPQGIVEHEYPERHDGAVLGIEVKAGDHVDSKQLAGLRKLRDRLGSAFIAGVAFHLGGRGYPVDDRLHSLPVERLWV